MANKEDLRRRNRELRHRISIRTQQEHIKKVESQKQKDLEKEKKLKDPKYSYPEFILTLLKRLKRIDPFNGVPAMEEHQAALVCYYKLKQFGMKELKIGANPLHAWVEFLYDNNWWIFDPIAVRKRNLGQPIKKKTEIEEPEYISLTRYFNNVADYFDTYGKDFTISKDECKIEAMEDYGLNTVMKINYH